VRISDATRPSYSVSEDVFPRKAESHESRLSQVGFEYADGPFSFKFRNIYNNETLINTEKRKFVVSEKFSEIGMVLPTKRIFGLGQGNRQFMLQNGTYSLWSKGTEQGLPVDKA